MNRTEPKPIWELIQELKTKPMVISGTANIIAINENRKHNH